MELRVKGYAAALKEAREEANLSQGELAARLGVSTRTVQNWEAGRTPQPKHRRAVAQFLLEQAA